MPGYLISKEQHKGIIFTDSKPIATTAKPLINCHDSELTGVPVYHNSHFICQWPEQNELLNSNLINIISIQIKNDNSTQLHETIQNAVFSKDNKPNHSFSNGRCPYTKFPINQTRNLCITLIPYDKFFIDNDIEDLYQESCVKQYFTNSRIVNQLMPSHSLPFALIEFSQIKLAVCEEIDISNTYNYSWLQTAIDVKKNLIAPYLEIIKQLHNNKLTHGDITSSNAALSVRFNKLIFVDFKHVGEVPYTDETDWHSKRLEDFHDMAGSIIEHLPSKDYKSNPAIIYLENLINTLKDFNAPPVISANKELTIETIIEHVNNFWTLSTHDIVHFAPKNLSSEQIDVLFRSYSDACQSNNSKLMSFYEEIYPQCRLNLNNLLPEDFANNSNQFFYPSNTSKIPHGHKTAYANCIKLNDTEMRSWN